jgi:ATP adenylyltransferase
MDYLFTPWRYQYITNASADEGKKVTCIFCAMQAGTDEASSYVVYRGRHSLIALNKFPYTSGHVMIAPYEHLDELRKLMTNAAHELIDLAQKAESVLRELYKPDGINLGMNLGRAAGAGVAGHIHLHVLPRWFGDTSFITTTSETRVLPESLEQTFERLKGKF